jgi:hypothetical protein
VSVAEQKKSGTIWSQTLIYFLMWLVSIAILIVDLYVIRQLLANVFLAIGSIWAAVDPISWRYSRLDFGWTRAFVDRGALLIMGVLGVGLAIYNEHAIRQGRDEGQLVKSGLRLLAIEAGVGVVSWVFSVLIAFAVEWLVL